MSRLPSNAAALVAMRRAGRKPALPVLISLIGALEFSNTTLSAYAGQVCDWRPIAALDVEVFASTGIPFGDLLPTLADIASAVPKSLVLTFREGPRVHCGEMRTITDFALFDWFPMAIGPSHYPAARLIEKRLWQELGATVPIPYDEACDLVTEIANERGQPSRAVSKASVACD